MTAAVQRRHPRSSLNKAVEQLQHLLAQDKTPPKRIIEAWSLVRALAKNCELDPDTEQLIEDLGDRSSGLYGLTDAIRSALFEAERPMNAVEIREWLRETGFDVRKYSFAMASIHSTLKRLIQHGEVSVLVDRGGYKKYVWRGRPVR